MSTNYILPDDEYEPEDVFLADHNWHGSGFAGNMLSMEESWEESVYTLSYRGVPFAPLGGIHALTGQSGNGKTFTFSLLIAALLGSKANPDLQCALPEGVEASVLYVDTEQERSTTLRVGRRVHSMIGWDFQADNARFRIMHLREVVDVEDRWRMVIDAISTLRPTAVFLDGLIDLVADYNDAPSCQQLVYECMAIATRYNCSIWCLVHQNPGSTTKMVGHLGSVLERKVTDIFETTKEKMGTNVVFTVKQKKARGRDVDDMTFTIQDGPCHLGEPVLGGAPTASDPVSEACDFMTETESAEWVKITISSQYGISTTDFRNAIKDVHMKRCLRKCSSAKADEIIRGMIDANLIRRGENKRYYIDDGTTQILAFNQPAEEGPPPY